jgi:hypothetical protein
MTTVESTVEETVTDRLSRLALLAGREARRLARHPALWLPLAVAAASLVSTALTGNHFSAGSWYAGIFVMAAMLGPAVAIFAANLVASSARRTGADEMLRVTPMADTERTLAMCLGVAFTLGAIGTATALAMSLLASDPSVGPQGLLTDGELAQIPAILALGGLLGVLTARWLRFPGAALVTAAVFAVGAVALAPVGNQTGTWWIWWYTTTPMEGLTSEEPFLSEAPGYHWWHTAYLVGLCACAAVAAVCRDRVHWPKLAALGLPLATLTAAFGWLQLP